MAGVSAWERIERQNLHRRERWRRHLRPGERPDPSRPAGTDMLPQVKHIVVLMMENHSFDNYLGTLGRGDGLSDPPPSNRSASGRVVTPFRLSSLTQPEGVPSQSWEASHLQYADGTNGGF